MGLPEVGSLALLLAFVLAVYGVVASVAGRGARDPVLVLSGRRAALAVAGLLALAALILLISFLNHDFSLRYVAERSSRDLPLQYIIAAFYSGQQGSLLYWVLMLSLFTALVVVQNRRRNQALLPYVLAILLGIQSFFLLLLAFVTSPFERLPVVPPDGQGLNPILKDPGILIHPPLLLLGYMSVSIPFAFAMAALITGQLDSQWFRTTRRWSLAAFTFLTLGNLLGAWWAYHVLGWGGYWGWDPVENSAFLPWVAMTAYVHSVMVQERRGMLKVWNLGLIILAFALAIFGTFVVRSGVLVSVHSFAQSAIGPFFFTFLGLLLVLALGCLWYRLPRLQPERGFESFASREAGFLFNNLLLVGIALATFGGTIFPLISEALRGVKLSVGAPFYRQVNGPLFLALIALMGLGPLLPWRRAAGRGLWRSVRLPLAGAAVVAVFCLGIGIRQPLAIGAYAVCGFTLVATLAEYLTGARIRRKNSGENWAQALGTLIWRNRPRFGGYLVHIGIVAIAIAVIGSSFFNLERQTTLRPGDVFFLGSYVLRYQGLSEPPPEAGIQRIIATIEVSHDGSKEIMRPEKQIHRNFEQQPTTTVAIRTTPLEDLYLVLNGYDEKDQSAVLHIFINPMVLWLWIGGAIMLVGIVVAVWPDRRRAPAPPPESRPKRRPSSVREGREVLVDA